MLNEIIRTAPALSRLPLVPLKNADTYYLKSTNIDLFQNNTTLKAPAKPSQTVYLAHTASDIRLLASSFSSFPVLTENPIDFPPANTPK